MLQDRILERIFAHKDMRCVPIGYQSTVINVITDVLYEMKGENPNVTISELLTATNPFVPDELPDDAEYDEYV